MLCRRPIPKRRLFIGRRHRPWPRAWPKFGRRLRYAVGVDYLGDLTQRLWYFYFFIAFPVLREIKENGKKFKKKSFEV
jgi:hypothetical protein